MDDFRTLGELRTEMRAKLGHAAAGSASGPTSTIIDSHLRDAQTMLYEGAEWARLRRYDDTQSIGLNQTLIDYPAAANPERIKAISVLRGGVWSPPLEKGISPTLYTYQLNYSWPQRWEPYDQIEIWPATDAIYQLRIFFVKLLAPLIADNDRFDIDDKLVGILATASLKAHYRQPDAALWETKASDLLLKLKAKSWGRDIFRPNDYQDMEPLVRPVVV